MSLFRESLLARLVLAHAISPELVQKLLAWRHPGFSAHVGETIAPTDKRRLEDTAAYLGRNPLSLRKLVYLDGSQAVLYRSRMNPSLGRNFEALDPLEASTPTGSEAWHTRTLLTRKPAQRPSREGVAHPVGRG